jgi:magnesium-transporting ATPase (P-type)
VRTEKITTVGRENLLLRGIRKVSKGPFGELITVSLKSFGRKAENLSKVFYGIVLATILPIMVQQVDPGTFDFSSIALMLGMMIGILGVFPFAGTGFLESKDQLWMIQSAPKGASHFMRARLVSGLLIAVPLALVPTTLVAFMFGMTAFEFLLLLVSSCLIVWGAVMVSMGMTARNPNYEDTKSPGYQTIIMGAMMLTVFSVMAPILLDLFSFLAGFSVFDFLESAFGTTGLRLFMIFSGPVCVLLVGALMMNLGVRSLSRPE